MSTHWTIFCDTCHMYGPDIRMSRTVLLSGKWPRHHPDFDHDMEAVNTDVQMQWRSFLQDHEWHKLELHHE